MIENKTAVEIFKENFFEYADPYPHFSEEDKWVITEREFLDLVKRAMEREKEQMFGFTNHFHVIGNGTKDFFTKEFEEYYQSKYGKKNDA